MKLKLSSICTLFLLGLVCFSYKAHAQQESQFTQYLYNTSNINPAYAGSRGSLSILGLYRNQWVGLDGAPETLNFTAHTPLGKQNFGVGLNFTSDKIGPSSESSISADVSYTIYFSRTLKLALGVKGGLSLLNIDPNKLTFGEPDDYDLSKDNFAAPTVGAGVYLYSEKFYLGLSTPNFLETKYYNDIKISTATEQTHFYLLGGYIYSVNDNLKLKPSALIKGVVGAPVSVDVSANALLYDRVSFGLNYRLGASVSALAGFQVTNQILIGYSYDYSTTELQHYNSGSHEIFLRFEIGSLLFSKVSPRFF